MEHVIQRILVFDDKQSRVIKPNSDITILTLDNDSFFKEIKETIIKGKEIKIGQYVRLNSKSIGFKKIIKIRNIQATEKNIVPYWYVMCSNGEKPIKKHKIVHSALNEAKRLLHMNPNQDKIEIMKVTHIVEKEKISVAELDR